MQSLSLIFVQCFQAHRFIIHREISLVDFHHIESGTYTAVVNNYFVTVIFYWVMKIAQTDV